MPRLAYRSLAAVAALSLAFSAAPGLADRATYTMPVSLSIVDGCTVSAAPLVFAMPVPTNQDFDSTSSITVRCNPNLAFTLNIDNGLHAQGNNRRVYNASANDHLNYTIHQTPPPTQVWGRGNTRNLAGNSGPTGIVVYPVYGRLKGEAGAAPGNYSDLLTISIDF